MTDILDLIDNAIDGYELSADGMRWTPDPPAVAPPTSSPRRDMSLMNAICRWLIANRIDPSVVPLDATAAIECHTIICDVFLRRNGRQYVLEDGETIVDGVARWPLLVEPRPEVAAWLAVWERDESEHCLRRHWTRPLRVDGAAYQRRVQARRRR